MLAQREPAEAFHFGEGAGLRWQDVAIPAQVLSRLRSTKKLQIVFKLLDAASPAQLGISRDARKLGVALHYLRLSKHTNQSQPLRVH